MVLYAVLIGGVAYAAWRWRAELIEIIAGWLAAWRNFWRSFFGGQREIGRSAEEVAFHQQQLLWSFSDFVDPFASGTAAASSPAELVKYTFAALEVWGREQGVPRGPDETPHEYVALMGSKFPRPALGRRGIGQSLFPGRLFPSFALAGRRGRPRAALAVDAIGPCAAAFNSAVRIPPSRLPPRPPRPLRCNSFFHLVDYAHRLH